MEQELLKIGISVAGILLLNFGTKLGRFALIMQKGVKFSSDYSKSIEDNKLTLKEKALLFDDIDGVFKEGVEVLKGFSFFKGKY